jgi:hypothetical protein
MVPTAMEGKLTHDMKGEVLVGANSHLVGDWGERADHWVHERSADHHVE